MKWFMMLLFIFSLSFLNGCANEEEENDLDKSTLEDKKTATDIKDLNSLSQEGGKVFISKTYVQAQACVLDPSKNCLCEVFQQDASVVKYANNVKKYCEQDALDKLQNGYTSVLTNEYIRGYLEQGYTCYITKTQKNPEETNVESIKKLICVPPS